MSGKTSLLLYRQPLYDWLFQNYTSKKNFATKTEFDKYLERHAEAIVDLLSLSPREASTLRKIWNQSTHARPSIHEIMRPVHQATIHTKNHLIDKIFELHPAIRNKRARDTLMECSTDKLRRMIGALLRRTNRVRRSIPSQQIDEWLASPPDVKKPMKRTTVKPAPLDFSAIPSQQMDEWLSLKRSH